MINRDYGSYGNQLKIIFKDGSIWRGARIEGYSWAPGNGEEEDDITVSYGGVLYGLTPSEIQDIQDMAKDKK
ncbi:hypothetical protein [Helicobacter suis]|uniref:hypothetical protein n=1 Tax=Helicobacter suis TaxID=104628 RepID=UPI0013D730B0|nr:hypothetical protein [Helicobacter suis]